MLRPGLPEKMQNCCGLGGLFAMTDDSSEEQLSPEEIARRRDETIKRMIKMPAKTQKGQPKRVPKPPQRDA